MQFSGGAKSLSGDEIDTFNTLGQAMSLARSDLLVDLSIDPRPMKPPGDDGLSGTDHVIGTFRYQDETAGTRRRVSRARGHSRHLHCHRRPDPDH